MEQTGVAVVGAGYWGPNLIRNLSAHPDADLRWVCDLDVTRAERMAGRIARSTGSLDDILSDPAVLAVAIATPVATHAEVALACLDAGKHVMIEKPLALSVAEGEKLLGAAQDADLVLMCDHTYCYTPAVRRIRDTILTGELGELQYFDSVRINLGLIQSDVDVFWDLAPHDLSILDSILPEEISVESVAAHGADPIGAGRACLGYLTLRLTGGAIAHIHVNWLSPTKIRTMIVGGARRIVVWDDLSPTQRLSMYDRGVELNGRLGRDAKRDQMISYRVGDMVAPALPEVEALHEAVSEFLTSIEEHRSPLTDGASGMRVLRILDAASRSLELGGASVPVEQ